MSMHLSVERVDFSAVAPLHEERRRAATAQLVRDSILPRGLADAWMIRAHGEPMGYAGVWREHFRGRLMELHVGAAPRDEAVEVGRAVLTATGAVEIEAQTNDPLLHEVAVAFTDRLHDEHLLFAAGRRTNLRVDGAMVRRRTPDDSGPDGEWIVVLDGEVVAGGGVLTHYNPPFADIYMAVEPAARRRGIGSYLVQELGGIARRDGLVPAARCGPENEASRRTLLRAGMVECARLVAGAVHGRI